MQGQTGSNGTLRFDEAALIAKLDRVGRELRVAFAGMCAERIVSACPAYEAVSGWRGGDVVRELLDRLWADLLGRPMSSEELGEAIETCMRAIPVEGERPWTPYEAYAEDAAAAVAYALQVRDTGQSREAAWAARRAYEAVDAYAIREFGIDINEPGAEVRILEHPTVQKELQCQLLDVDSMLDMARQHVNVGPGELRRLRGRAMKCAHCFRVA